jgi:hypothetical protein
LQGLRFGQEFAAAGVVCIGGLVLPGVNQDSRAAGRCGERAGGGGGGGVGARFGGGACFPPA